MLREGRSSTWKSKNLCEKLCLFKRIILILCSLLLVQYLPSRTVHFNFIFTFAQNRPWTMVET
jgi:hypothetical protein